MEFGLCLVHYGLAMQNSVSVKKVSIKYFKKELSMQLHGPTRSDVVHEVVQTSVYVHMSLNFVVIIVAVHVPF